MEGGVETIGMREGVLLVHSYRYTDVDEPFISPEGTLQGLGQIRTK